ncbi:MAG: septation protein SpoVG family protein [Calditrichia bacterium]
MEVSAIRLVSAGKIKAKVDIRTSEGFIIKGFKVIEEDNGFFVGMPSERAKTGKYIDTVKVEDPAQKEMLESLVMDAYRKKIK